MKMSENNKKEDTEYSKEKERKYRGYIGVAAGSEMLADPVDQKLKEQLEKEKQKKK
jgi:hypothetical protein